MSCLKLKIMQHVTRRLVGKPSDVDVINIYVKGMLHITVNLRKKTHECIKSKN